ncbi:formate/nitrite transporter family protein [Oscillibacter sp.]|uniref:formate/nitrite transporter family protein n=1 Tax=Oscillibacter sp. TaxID=1945593 RepID=UPI00260C258A|nr:formate/nitrite transporter family protein [Oscillibacter sp.]MDD3346839.1 formate/nitrite transporter family protein [Oscillibacter sp.]
MKQLASFLYSILGGICIAIGGVAFLSCESKVVGAIFFCVGLFTICTFGFHLFTGKVGYVFEQPFSYTGFVLSIWLGNLLGTGIVGYAVRATRISGIAEKATALCQTKLDDTVLSIFILSVFCNILMFVAVDGFKTNPHPIGKYIGVFLGVIVFILCGFEHCVANMFYFSVANLWSGKAFAYLLVMSIGNACGGVIIPLCRRLRQSVEA